MKKCEPFVNNLNPFIEDNRKLFKYIEGTDNENVEYGI
jgi:hypothetical protein